MGPGAHSKKKRGPISGKKVSSVSVGSAMECQTSCLMTCFALCL